MKYFFLALIFGFVMLLPQVAAARSDAGCMQKQLATAVQGSKMMVRCYGLAARTEQPVESSCLERAARRMKVTLSRMAAGGCPPVEDSDQIVAETISFMDRVTTLLTPAAKPVASTIPAPATPQPAAK